MTINKQAYFKHGPHLALYHETNGLADYWDGVWVNSDIKHRLEVSKRGELGEFEYPFIRYLPRDGAVLEAGCGTGRYVAALRARGFAVEGIDYAEKTIRIVQEADPTLNVRIGDIFAIDRPDNYYAGYISLGVLEHNFEGMEKGIAEACRVLRPQGVALISVPYLNWRRRKIWQHAPEATSPELDNGLRFYQDHLDTKVFAQKLTAAGFEVIELYPYALYGGLIRDWRLWQWLDKRSFFSYRFKKFIGKLCRRAPSRVRFPLSHMMMFVCRK